MADPLALPRAILTFPKTVELEQRLSRAEVMIAGMRETMAARDAEIAYLRDSNASLQKRLTALQAQLDHLFAKTAPSVFP